MNKPQPPKLSPLFFHTKGMSTTQGCGKLSTLPSEILNLCLAEHANWGDLAKLACVRKEWSTIMMDAAAKDPDSKWQLAQALMDGTCGLRKNRKLAMKLLKELANVTTDNNNFPECTNEISSECFAPAMKCIAECYFEGTGVAQDSKIGLAWLKSAYEMGNDIDAAHDAALIYEFGRNGVEIDIVAAAEWLEKAAEGGHIESMAELGLCYELGCGVEQSDERALDWYMKAANEGHVIAKFSVGEAFEEARGVPQSDAEACLWYYKAASLGDEDSKVALRRLEDIARIVLPPAVGALLDE